MASSINNSSSRYVQGGDTETYSNRLSWWERREFTKDADDINITITDRTHHRPDLLSYDLYEDSSYGWMILQYNNILDITDEFVVGAEFVAPTAERLFFVLMNKETGGKDISTG